MVRVWPGTAYPLGATWDGAGTNFALFSEVAEQVELCLLEGDDPAQLAETTMDPRYRTLRRIRIEDAAAATGMFSLLMGTEVAPRRDFIVAGAAELDPSRIDA